MSSPHDPADEVDVIVEAISTAVLRIIEPHDREGLEEAVREVIAGTSTPESGWLVMWWMSGGWDSAYPGVLIDSRRGWNVLHVGLGLGVGADHVRADLAFADAIKFAADQGGIALVIDIETCF